MFQRWQKKQSARNHHRAIHNLITPAFECGGKTYYEFNDFRDMPVQRALKVGVFYTEFQMSVTLDYLRLHCRAVKEKLEGEGGIIDVLAICEMNEQLISRLQMPVDVPMIYKMASALFFDETEDITDYDPLYCAQKVEHWKKHLGAKFLLLKPLREFLPMLTDADGLGGYERSNEKLNNAHLGKIIGNLPPQITETLKGGSYIDTVIFPKN